MKTISTALSSHLAGEVISICTCWKLTRRDGVIFGFADHDSDITFDSIVYI